MSEDDELTEPILREIMRLRGRIRQIEDSIGLFETILESTREETGLTHEQLRIVDAGYRHTSNSIRSLRGWITRYKKQIEELEKQLPPPPPPPVKRMLRIIITFSIETGTGHEPLFAEVDSETIVDLYLPNEDEIIYRVVNATIKLFWICFDSFKELMEEYRALWGAEEYDRLLDTAIFFQKHALIPYKIDEKLLVENKRKGMDNFIKSLIGHGAFKREPNQYASRQVDSITKQAIIKIGVYHQLALDTQEPQYPDVHILIEKGKSAEHHRDFTIERLLMIADETVVGEVINILKLLQMAITIERMY